RRTALQSLPGVRALTWKARLWGVMGPNPACRWFALLLSAAALLVCAPAAATERAVLIEALRGGGYVLYFRHAQTDWSLQDRIDGEDSWASCDPARMRQLSDEGRATARAVGAAMTRLEIPVAAVY